MAYRNGTYVAFHAEGTANPSQTDQRYYRILQAWKESDDLEFTWVNSHDKTAAVRDTSKQATLAGRLRQRLASSRNMLLIIGNRTRCDKDWIPFEIRLAVENYKIPIIAAYPGKGPIFNPNTVRPLWPAALETRIDNNTAHVIHVPFRLEPIKDAICQFDHKNFPPYGGLGFYSREAYRSWKML